MISPADFPKVFEALTGAPPFPWQASLFDKFSSGLVPASANIPTGLGKTSVIAIWLCALASKPQSMPRRLVYVVNRRTVVDQTTNEVEKWRERLALANLTQPLAQLASIPLATNEPPLAISTLRGQFADNREWSADPARPAVIVGTVDMIGSRLLFNGYGVGYKVRPHHAGLLGQDSLVVHDEAHLEPAFQTLLETVSAQQVTDREFRPLRVLALSATSRSPSNAAHTLSPADEENPTVHRRLNAPKRPSLHPVTDEKKETAEKLAALALAKKGSGRAVLIFARSLEVVHRVIAALEKDKLENPPAKLVGPLRGFERDRLVENPVFQRFLPASNLPPSGVPIPAGTVYLVATSAGEVGVNLSADDLVCDLSTFESMAQRIGRVNRFGELTDSTIEIVHPETFDEQDPLAPYRQRTLDLFRLLVARGTASPAALNALQRASRIAAFSPQPEMLPATEVLFDAWALTTIQGRLPGRPAVAPYLHGVAAWEPPETRVVWRSEVDWITPPLRSWYDPVELLADFPIRSHEILRDSSYRVIQQLMLLASRPEAATASVWLLDETGNVSVVPLAEFSDRDSESRIQDKTILLPPSLGGLLPDGSLDGKAPAGVAKADVADTLPNRNSSQQRLRMRVDGKGGAIRVPDGYRLIRPPLDLLVETDSEEGSGEGELPPAGQGRYWCWLESADGLPDANTHQSRSSVLLEVHRTDVERLTDSITAKVQLRDDLRKLFALAARYHDSGKSRREWQRGIGNSSRAILLAKASPRLRSPQTGDGYRHEFGSLLDLTKDDEFLALPDEDRELVLHLVA
ncbi:MAG: type I-U CRISPR-associated helicase/endonuclease Cas3, partial [Verrucomicrobia bacterium]|nr:type I-U CRISPR-associated helicase/endonuclease Cas3 [Verrucomicrobiota bacterium]